MSSSVVSYICFTDDVMTSLDGTFVAFVGVSDARLFGFCAFELQSRVHCEVNFQKCSAPGVLQFASWTMPLPQRIGVSVALPWKQ